jgi:hypothetical protein
MTDRLFETTNQTRLTEWVERSLLPGLKLESVHPAEPIIVREYPEGWQKLGSGNYAGVFAHPDYVEFVVKVYAPGRPGWEDEIEVYRRLGGHPAYSQCCAAGESGGHRYLVLRRLRGKTLYQCLTQGVTIPGQLIADIDAALAYARSKGLNPHDVHGKNVMLSSSGRGYVVDVSDFLKTEKCTMWDDMKKAYQHLYVPLLSKQTFKVPEWLMEGVRKGYRLFRSAHSD